MPKSEGDLSMDRGMQAPGADIPFGCYVGMFISHMERVQILEHSLTNGENKLV